MISTDTAGGRTAVIIRCVDLSICWGRMAVAGDEQPPVRNDPVARSSRATPRAVSRPVPRRLSSSVEIVRVRGPDAAHLAEIQAEAIKEVLQWALEQHSQHQRHEQHIEDRAA